MDDNHVIGTNNRLPWRLPADMKWFRHHTMGKPMLMGRKTFESFGAEPLPGRQNIIITRNQNYHAKGCSVVHSIEAALAAAETGDEIMVIGGASFYAQMLPRAQRMYLTLVHGKFNGDSWFPAFDRQCWREIKRIDCDADEKNPYSYSFVTLERKNGQNADRGGKGINQNSETVAVPHNPVHYRDSRGGSP